MFQEAVTASAIVPAEAATLGVALPPTPVSEQLSSVDEDLEQARTFLERRDVDAEFVATVGPPADAIVEIADKRAADLIVVGTREPSFLERLLTGSVSDDVSRRAHCDALIVH